VQHPFIGIKSNPAADGVVPVMRRIQTVVQTVLVKVCAFPTRRIKTADAFLSKK
jgi:hypothetical protein